jgi:hypothetical protein
VAELEAKKFKVSRTKTVLLASGPSARAHLKEQASPDLDHMIARHVKDLGVDSTLGGARNLTVQKQRVQAASDSAERVAWLPLGWRPRVTIAAGLVRAQMAWGADIVGMGGKAIKALRHRLVKAVTGATPPGGRRRWCWRRSRRVPSWIRAISSPSRSLGAG